MFLSVDLVYTVQQFKGLFTRCRNIDSFTTTSFCLDTGVYLQFSSTSITPEWESLVWAWYVFQHLCGFRPNLLAPTIHHSFSFNTCLFGVKVDWPVFTFSSPVLELHHRSTREVFLSLEMLMFLFIVTLFITTPMEWVLLWLYSNLYYLIYCCPLHIAKCYLHVKYGMQCLAL